MLKKRLLLLSNSKNYGQGYLEHAEGVIRDFLGSNIKRVTFIPFARVLPSFQDFASKVGSSFEGMGYELDSLHNIVKKTDAVRTAQAIIIGGGNTFHLLNSLYEMDLLDSIRKSVSQGVPYIGWSAGANVVCPTIKTTNDMPIIEPRSFRALDLVPFQINPHYTDEAPVEHQTETREERIAEFVEINPQTYVVGLREGTMLRIESDNIELLGNKGARVFAKGKDALNYSAGESIRFLLEGRSYTDKV